MTQFFTAAGMQPFSIALALVLGLVLLELVMLLLGGSLLTSEADGPELDLDADAGADIEAGLDELDMDGPDTGGSGAGSALTWLGIGRVPVIVWIASFLAGFGLSGFVLQQSFAGAFGAMLPAMLAVPAALAPAVLFAKIVSGWLGRLVPRTETSAMQPRHFAGLHGTVTQGTARRGQPAEVRVRDRHGNLHYLRLEPYEDTDLPAGTDVTVIRRKDGTLSAMGLGPAG